jgi:hypothetical protein
MCGEVLDRMIGMALDVALRHEAAERLPQHDGLDDAQRVAQAHDVVGEGVQRPLLRRPAVAAAVAAVVVVDHLRDVGHAAEERPEGGVVEAGAAVQQEQGRLLAQHRAVGHVLRAFDVEVEADAGFDLDSHVIGPPVQACKHSSAARMRSFCAERSGVAESTPAAMRPGRGGS